LLNCAYTLAARRLHKRSEPGKKRHLRAVGIFAATQIVLDLFILTCILHFAGGIHNPFCFYYVFHVILASILLTRRSAYGVAALCVVLYSAMVLLEFLRVITLSPLAAHIASYTPGYVATSIIAIGSTLFLSAFMATSIMTRLQEKENELEKAMRAVKKLEETKSRFLRLVSHEMKSPIVAIQAILDALHLTSKDTMTPKSAQMLARAGERAQSLLTLTKDLLTHSRLQATDAGHDDENAENIDMLSLTRKSIQFHRPQAEKRGIRLVEEYPEKPFHVSGDGDLLDLVLTNLLSNAIRYTPAGGEVRVAWKLGPAAAVLTVADTGIGIPQSEMQHLFHEFFRAQNAKNFTASGTGLGLAITKSVIDNAGGNISVQSTENQGTTFTVQLPLAL
ncbi:MAG: HAMP domain-containing histidine kinase, partial [Planctomycetes bacterium]|nr:HAMP domain-containing histidine kinase [Planctomycetota bacterium]